MRVRAETWELSMTETTDGSIVRLAGEGETTSLFGDTYTIKAAGVETGATLAVIEAELAPHSSGTPLHVNTREAESYYVLEGTLTFRLGERTVEASAGAFVHIPQGVVHTHWNATSAPVRLLGVPAPAGFETFFAELAELMATMPPGPPDMTRVSALYERFGLQVVGPPPNSGR
jgi:quercetin dioxygenase-like cupin family protein